MALRQYPVIDETARLAARMSAALVNKRHGVMVHMTARPGLSGSSLGYMLDNPSLASADWLIDRDGTIHRLTKKTRYAYHAGKGYGFIHGRKYTGDQLSQALVGVELEAHHTEAPTWQQYEALAYLITNVLAPEFGWAFPFVIMGHYATARHDDGTLGRRSDPWLYDWGGWFGNLYAYAHERGML